jgi:hypothetical protein
LGAKQKPINIRKIYSSSFTTLNKRRNWEVEIMLSNIHSKPNRAYMGRMIGL